MYKEPLTLFTCLNHLQLDLDALLPRQIDDPDHPSYGALISPRLGMADVKHTEYLIVTCAYLALGRGEVNPTLFDRAILAADYLLQAQRSSGLIDLQTVNPDSSPDTGFTVQRLCAVIELGRPLAENDKHWAALVARLELFVRRSVPGMLTGGFHTPNHRWVIASALAQAHTLFPDLDVAETVEAYLAEGFDLDEDGCFIEHSIGNYDAVNDRALLLIAEHWDRPDALDAVARNLAFNLSMLHADGTAITNLSTRFDYGTRDVPVGLIPCLLDLDRWRPDPRWRHAANALWRLRPEPVIPSTWLCHTLITGGGPATDDVKLSTDFSQHYAHNGVWRVVRDQMSAVVFRDKTNLMSMVFGEAELSAVKISFTYFGDVSGWFFGDSLSVDGSRAVLRSEGLRRPRRPGYELPLGRPAPPEQWDALNEERDLRRLPPLTSKLTIDEVDDGFDLHLKTLDGLDDIAAQIAFDFAPGGVWATADNQLKPQAGQEIFLRQGAGTMRYGNDLIRISPGASAHTFWQMRATELAPDHVRVVLTFVTPIDFAVQLRVARGWQVDQ